MKKFNSATDIMMEFAMQVCCMCMDFCAFLSNMFSISKAKHFAA